jgi:hypothetical protein
MGSGFNVDVAEVRAHASTVATLSSQVNAATRTAAASVTDNAYGLIGQFFAAAIMAASDQVREGILRAAQSMREVQAGLEAVADLYQQVDETRARLFSLTKGDERR